MSILFVSIAFPPKFDSEGLQVAKYFKYLQEECEKANWPLDVVTSSVPTLFMPVDESLRTADSGYRQKIEIRIRENKYVNYLVRKLATQWIDRPDSKHSFFQQWEKVVRQLREKPSVIYSRSFPASSAIMAMKLKKHYNVPWVMHLSDPWADSPVSKMNEKVRKINESFENQCFQYADKICLTSYPTIDFYREKYPRYSEKFEFFPNVYDPEDILVKLSRPQNPKLRFVYSGGLAGIRSPEPLLKAIILLPDSAKAKMEFVFSGIADRSNSAIFEKYADTCISYIGSKDTYKEAIKLQQTADVLLLIDFPVKEKKMRVYFLSKLVDYMVAGKYILAVSGEGSVSRQVIDEKLGKCFAENETEALKDHLLFLLAEFEKNPSFAEKEGVDPVYDAKKNAFQLFKLLKGLAGES